MRMIYKYANKNTKQELLEQLGILQELDQVQLLHSLAGSWSSQKELNQQLRDRDGQKTALAPIKHKERKIRNVKQDFH